MNAPRSSGLFRWLPAAALVALVPLLGYPYLLLVLLVLGLNLTVTAARPAPYELFVTVVTLIALPYAGGAVLPGPARPLALLLILLGLPWLDGALRRCAGWAVRSSPGAAVVPLPGRRGMTPLLAALGTGLTLAAGAGLTARQPLMAAATAILLGAVTARALVSYVRLAPHRSLSSRVWTVRVLAGHPATATATLTSGAPWPLRVALRLSEPWAVLDTPDFLLPARGERAVALHLRPPLAGPDRVTATATAWDPWGLIVQRQRVVLAEVRVIPRAAYAAWLAQRYLEQAQDGALPAPAITEPKQAQAARRGLDYYGARLYEPGDALRDVFWKPTIKLGQIVVKDRRQGRGEPVVASVNLLAADAEEKDRLAHALLTSVLTLAREGVPVALAAYAPEGVVEVTPPLAPQPALRAALSLLDRIRTAPRPLRVLAPPQSTRLRRTVARLLTARSDAALRTARLLALEHEALLRRMDAHPATEALRKARLRVPTPAAVLPVTPDPDDLAVLEVALRHAPGLGFRMLPPAHTLLPARMSLPTDSRTRAHPRVCLAGRTRAAPPA